MLTKTSFNQSDKLFLEFCYLQVLISITMLIFSPEISPRLNYTLDLIFRNILNIDFSLTDNKESFINHVGARLNYSTEKIGDIPFVEASELLFEDSINDQIEEIREGLFWDDLPIFFASKKDSILPFDIFAATFYLVSRYEEYLPFEADKHSRFHSGLSLASKLNFINEPIIDQWLIKFGALLESLFPDEIKPVISDFSFEATIDIDNAWAFKNKGFWRTLGSILRTGQSTELRSFRYQVLRGKQHDPFDKYQKMEMIHKRYGCHPRFFFLVGPYGKFDRNISPENKQFRSLIKDISGNYETGLHPSYSSFSDPGSILEEKNILNQITGKDISTSRQHYLRLRFPLTYQALIKAEIFNDYSMGYADRSGFRAGTSREFKFFDLVNNNATSLSVFPFQVMDTGLRDYENCSPAEAIARIKSLIEKTRAVGGTFRCLWHNESFSEWSGWEGWTAVYEEMLTMAGKNQ